MDWTIAHSHILIRNHFQACIFAMQCKRDEMKHDITQSLLSVSMWTRRSAQIEHSRFTALCLLVTCSTLIGKVTRVCPQTTGQCRFESLEVQSSSSSVSGSLVEPSNQEQLALSFLLSDCTLTVL